MEVQGHMSKRKVKILFIGAGAVCSYLGACLTHAGHDVTLVDAWADQIEAIRARGIYATGPHDPVEARPQAVHLIESAKLGADFDVAFVGLKAYDTAWATQLALRHLSAKGYVVSAQNCWVDPIMASVAGADRSVGLVMSKIFMTLTKPGVVDRGYDKSTVKSGDVVFRPGEHDGRLTPRVTALADMLSGMATAEATDNLWGERWSKLSQNAMSNPLQAMSGLGSVEVLSLEAGRALSILLAAESARIGLKLGYRIPNFGGAPTQKWANADQPGIYEELDRQLTPTSEPKLNWRSSMAQDVLKGRKTEIDFMNGHIVSMGREVGVATPVSAAVVSVVREIDAGERKPSPEAITVTLRRAGP
jgi:2-dehydropantoate 2-reductase